MKNIQIYNSNNKKVYNVGRIRFLYIIIGSSISVYFKNECVVLFYVKRNNKVRVHFKLKLKKVILNNLACFFSGANIKYTKKCFIFNLKNFLNLFTVCNKTVLFQDYLIYSYLFCKQKINWRKMNNDGSNKIR